MRVLKPTLVTTSGCRPIQWVLLLLVILLAVITQYVKLNVMSSAPMGVYLLSRAPQVLTPGAMVLVQTPSTSALMRLLHGVLVGAWPLLKPVAAVAGETICREADRLRINTNDWGPIYATSPAGHSLPQWLTADECRVLSAGEVFLASRTDGSLDSRYVGPIPVAAIQAEAIPLLTWGP